MTEKVKHKSWQRWGVISCGVSFLAFALFIAGGCLILPLVGSMPLRWQSDNQGLEQEPWVEVGFDLPSGAGHVVFLRQHAHPFLAEYRRKLRLEMSGRVPVTLDLPMNVGGKTIINAYWHYCLLSDLSEVSVLRLEDRWGEYLVDLQNLGLLDSDDIVYLSEGTYIGRFDGRKGSLQFIPPDQGAEEAIDKG